MSYRIPNKKIQAKSNESQKINWDEVRVKLPSKPGTWKCKDMAIFLQMQNLKSVVDSFRKIDISSAMLFYN